MKKSIRFAVSVILIIAFFAPYSGAASLKDTSKNVSEKLIALTFDDGPHPRYTPQILDILAEYGVKATFFEVGENVKYYSDVAKRVIEEGHEIGNHTYTHPHIKSLDGIALLREVDECENEIYRVTGVRPTLFRPPEGVVDEAVKVMAQEKNYSLVLWDIDTRDWAAVSVNAMVNNIVTNISSGDIILMHDYISKKCHTVESLRIIIPALLNNGYRFVTVSELLERR